MTDAIFAHPRLAPLYDAFEGERDDLAAYLAIADELNAHDVVDLGCGTGSLAILLAESGRRVVGVDPAGASLEVARSKDPSITVTWMHGDATALPPGTADLVVMAGNVAQVLLTDESWSLMLTAVHTALRSDGYLVFETRRPGRRDWENWTADTVAGIADTPASGRVERRLEVTAVSLPFVSFRYTYRFLADDSIITSDSTLRFRSRDDVRASLHAHGYRVVDVRDAPDRPGREYVFIAECTR